MADWINANQDMVKIIGAIVLIIVLYVVSRIISERTRRKNSVFFRHKNKYKDSTGKKKNPDGTVYHRFSKRKR